MREQRQMVIQLMQTEQQRYDMLLRLLQSGAASTASRRACRPLPRRPPPAGTTTGPGAAPP